MKNRAKYDYSKLAKFTIIIGIIISLLFFAVTKYFDISRDGFFYSVISGFIVGALIPLLLAIMNKTGIDKFLLKNDKDKDV